MPLTTPAKRRRLLAICEGRSAASEWAPSAPVGPPSPRPSLPVGGGALPLSPVPTLPLALTPAVMGPKRNEFRAAMGRAPIVKMSRMMPPTPVAAPYDHHARARVDD